MCVCCSLWVFFFFFCLWNMSDIFGKKPHRSQSHTHAHKQRTNMRITQEAESSCSCCETTLLFTELALYFPAKLILHLLKIKKKVPNFVLNN